MKKQAAIGFIFITLLIDVIGWGLIIPVMPQLIAGMKHIPVNEAAKDGGWLLFVYAFMQFILCTDPGQSERSVWKKTSSSFFFVWIWH